MNILVRADSSSSIGAGHIMRDLVLVRQYPNSNITFAAKNLEGNLNTKIIEEGCRLEVLVSDELDELIKLIKLYQIDMVIIDHYEIDFVFEKELRRQTGVKLMVLDDSYEKHDCDILLNHNVYAEKVRYQGLVPSSCELRCGAKHTLLREEFVRNKKKANRRKLGDKKVLLAMGGADSSNLNVSILKCLKRYKDFHIDVVTTSANARLLELKAYVAEHSNITLHVNASNMAELMSSASFAILTPSVVVNEAIYMGLPFVAVQTADNQHDMHNYLINQGYQSLPLFSESQFNLALGSIIVDLYVERINFIDLSEDEKREVLEWRNNSEVRKRMFSTVEINVVQHMAYIESLKEKKEGVCFYVRELGEGIGVVSLSNINFNAQYGYLGIYANPEVKGKGVLLMATLLNYAFYGLKLKSVFAEVYQDNFPAIKLYERSGFKEKDIYVLDGKKVCVMELIN